MEHPGSVRDGDELRSFLGVTLPGDWSPEPITTDATPCDGYTRHAVRYVSREGQPVAAWLLRPSHGADRGIGVVAFHQHARQWHLGRSEVAGLAGDEVNAFGPALARAGVTVLAPDAWGFEGRRPTRRAPRRIPTTTAGTCRSSRTCWFVVTRSTGARSTTRSMRCRS